MKKLVRQETTYYDNFDLKEFKEYYDNTLTIHERYDERNNLIFFDDGKGFTMEKIFKTKISNAKKNVTQSQLLDYYKDSDGAYYECFYFPRETMSIQVTIHDKFSPNPLHDDFSTYRYYELEVKITNQDHNLNDFKLTCTKNDIKYPWVIQTCTGKMTLYRSRNNEKMLEILKDKLDITHEIWESNNYKIKFTF